MGKGFLAARFDAQATFADTDFRSILPRFTPEALAANQALVELLQRFASTKHITAAQIALAWLLAQKPWIVPIPGTTKPQRLKENLAAEALSLNTDELEQLSAAASQIKLQGERYPEELEKRTGL